MSDGRFFLFLIASCTIWPGLAFAVAYLIVCVVPTEQPKAQGTLELDRRVRFEARWVMVLAIPAVLYGFMGGLGDTWKWFGLLILALALAVYAMVSEVLMGGDLKTWQRYTPAVVAFCGLPIAMLCERLTYVPTYDEQAAPWANSLMLLILGSNFGVGYAAWCVSGIRFARAVGRRQHCLASDSVPVAHVDVARAPRVSRASMVPSLQGWADWARHE